MHFSRHRLHSPVISSPQHQAAVALRFSAIASRPVAPAAALVSPGTIVMPLTTVSLNSNFDAYIQVGFRGGSAAGATPLLVDSGNSTLIVPRWEDIAALPNSSSNYQILGAGHEPWGCPANIVRGPITLATTAGTPYEIPDCVFYACTGGSDRTANFGAACLSPWSCSGWNVPAGACRKRSRQAIRCSASSRSWRGWP